MIVRIFTPIIPKWAGPRQVSRGVKEIFDKADLFNDYHFGYR